MATQLVSVNRVRLKSRSVQLESLSRSPLEFGVCGEGGVRESLQDETDHERGTETCKLKGPGRLRCVINEPFRDGGREWRETLPSPRLSSPLDGTSVPEALDKSPLLFRVCSFICTEAELRFHLCCG